MITIISQILYWSVYAIVVTAVLAVFAALNVSFIKDMWAEFRMPARIRLASARIRTMGRSLRRVGGTRTPARAITLQHRPA